jgi:hypothetical protein
MVAKKSARGYGIEGVPELGSDPTFELLVAGLAKTSPRTVAKFLRGETVGRSAGERDALGTILDRATREAVALRRTESPLDKDDEGFGKALGKAAARFVRESAREARR